MVCLLADCNAAVEFLTVAEDLTTQPVDKWRRVLFDQ